MEVSFLISIFLMCLILLAEDFSPPSDFSFLLVCFLFLDLLLGVLGDIIPSAPDFSSFDFSPLVFFLFFFSFDFSSFSFNFSPRAERSPRLADRFLSVDFSSLSSSPPPPPPGFWIFPNSIVKVFFFLCFFFVCLSFYLPQSQ